MRLRQLHAADCAGAVVRILAQDHHLDRVRRRQVQRVEDVVREHRLAGGALAIDKGGQLLPRRHPDARVQQRAPGGGQGVGLDLQAGGRRGLAGGAGVGGEEIGLHASGKLGEEKRDYDGLPSAMPARR
ncbi:hypothetical protein D3C72_1748450 [compost metagenome]